MSLVIENLSAGYGKKSVLDGVEAAAKPGELIGLVGPNGAGKSCLLKTVAGLITPDDGHVNFSGQSVHTFTPRVRSQKIAWLAQDRSAAWALSVRELVCLGRAPYRGRLGKLSAGDENAVAWALTSAHCAGLQNRRFDHLSGGEQARVLLARALAVDAPLLLADEPIASLDPYFQISIMQSLRNVAQSGKIVITSLHDLALARQFCDKIWVMNEGRLVRDAEADNALSEDVLADVFKIKSRNGQITRVQKQEKT